MVTKTEEKVVERKSQKRRPFGVPVSRLSINVEIPGYHLRWINDEPGRIPRSQESGYAFVEPEEVGRVSNDNRVSELVGVQRDGSPMVAYLMKIPTEFYLEDRGLLESRQKDIDDAVRRGKLGQQSGDGRYVPDGGISYKN